MATAQWYWRRRIILRLSMGEYLFFVVLAHFFVGDATHFGRYHSPVH